MKWYCFEVKWVTVKFLGTKVPCILGWPYTEGTWLYCHYFIWCVSCTVVALTCFVMCGWSYVGEFWKLCGPFSNMCTCIYSVSYCFGNVYVFLCVLSLLVYKILPQSENSIAVIIIIIIIIIPSPYGPNDLLTLISIWQKKLKADKQNYKAYVAFLLEGQGGYMVVFFSAV